MDTNKHTATRTNGKVTIQVTIERGTWKDTIYSDGWEIGQRTEIIDRTQIAIKDQQGKTLGVGSEIRPLYATSGKQVAEAIKRGCLGRVGDVFIGPESHALIVSALAEATANAPKTAKQIEIETAQATKAAAAEAYRNSPQGQADAAAMRRHAELMREMDRADSDL